MSRTKSVKCNGRFHVSQTIKHIGELMLFICDDPTCAEIEAVCEHTNNKWTDDRTALICQFCGRNVT